MTAPDEKTRGAYEVHSGQIDIHDFKVVDIDWVENFFKSAQTAAGNLRWLPGYSGALRDEMELASRTLPAVVEESLGNGDIETTTNAIERAQRYHEEAMDAAILLASIPSISVDRLPEPKTILDSPGAKLHMAEYLAAWYSLANSKRAEEEQTMTEDSRRLIVRSVAEHFDWYTPEALQFVYRASKANAVRRVALWAQQLISPPVVEAKQAITAQVMEEIHQQDALGY